jgi:hypothetical protein
MPAWVWPLEMTNPERASMKKIALPFAVLLATTRSPLGAEPADRVATVAKTKILPTVDRNQPG